MEYKDYYRTLGVSREATAAEIKKAYRKLARKYHPDVSKEADADARMRELNEAHAVLSDTERRAAYDAIGRDEPFGHRAEPREGFDAGADDYSAFFEELLERMRAPGQRGRRSAFVQRGEDQHAGITLDLADAYRGGRRQITLRVPRSGMAGQPGRAARAEVRTLDVKIPKGVRAGQRIRLAGQGLPGIGGAPAGDLFLEMSFAAGGRYVASGRDVLGELPVAPWEAALGAVVPVVLPDGSTLKVRIPAGAQSGRQLTLRGRGIPADPPGDLDLTVRVVLPPADTPQAKALYEAMARELPFDARAA